MTTIVTWPSFGDKNFTTELREIGERFESESGVYIFCREDASHAWHAVFVGECENFNASLARHPRLASFRKHGATNICVIPVDGGKLRRSAVETDLCRRLDPPCNRAGEN